MTIEKLKQRKLGNSGFSLVELIIVIAIMAILIAVLAPVFLRFVERSRISRDAQAAGELVNAAKIAMGDPRYTASDDLVIVWDCDANTYTVSYENAVSDDDLEGITADIQNTINGTDNGTATAPLDSVSSTAAGAEITITIGSGTNAGVGVGQVTVDPQGIANTDNGEYLTELLLDLQTN